MFEAAKNSAIHSATLNKSFLLNCRIYSRTILAQLIPKILYPSVIDFPGHMQSIFLAYRFFLVLMFARCAQAFGT